MNSQNPAPAAAPTTSAAPSSAPAPVASTTTDDRGGAFRAIDGAGESVSGGNLLIAAYAVVWFIVLALVVRTFTRQSATAEGLAKLEEQIKKAAKP